MAARIGRTPIREAMQRLARERLLWSCPDAATFVTRDQGRGRGDADRDPARVETLVMETAAARASETEQQAVWRDRRPNEDRAAHA